MATERFVIPGIVKNVVVMPQHDTPLPDGAHVDILSSQTDVTPTGSRIGPVGQASDEAWAMIDRGRRKNGEYGEEP